MTDQERLAAYDRMYADLLKEREKVLADMDRLREAGKQKGATYQQLLAQKLTLRTSWAGLRSTASGRSNKNGRTQSVRPFWRKNFSAEGTEGPPQACYQ